MRCLISGGAGFIGSHLADRLMAEGHQVTVYDNLSSGRREFIAHHLDNPRFHFIESDLLDMEPLRGAMAGQEVVFHLAANPEAREGIQKTDLDLRIGTIATYNVLEAMRQEGIGKLVFASSGTVYGEVPPHPVSEDHGPMLPISLYGASKLACEGLISAFRHIFGLQAWIYRFVNVVGGRATHGVIYDFINKLRQNPQELEILGDGNQEKPYLLVDECVDGILFGFYNVSNDLNIFHLGGTTTTDVMTIARIVVDEMELSGVRLRTTGGERGWPGDVPQCWFSVDRMGALGWRARISSDDAVRAAVRRILGKPTHGV